MEIKKTTSETSGVCMLSNTEKLNTESNFSD
jgi:hypothetical protein